MFGKIFSKELKYQFTSLSIIILTVFLILMYYTQFVGDIERWPIEPILPQESDTIYTIYSIEDNLTLKDLEKGIYKWLKYDYDTKTTSRYGKYIERVELKDEQINIIYWVMKKLVPKNLNDKSSFKLSDKEFKELMSKVYEKLGSESVYNEDRLRSLAVMQKQYDEKSNTFKKLVKQNKLSDSYARLFCDYMGFILGLFSVFITAFTFTKDKRYEMHELVYTKEISSAKYVISKYFANIFGILIIVFLITIHPTAMFYNIGKRYGIMAPCTAFFKYSIFWLVPTVMFVTSLSYVLQLIFNNGIVPIAIQFFYWRYSIDFSGNSFSLTKYVIRFNSVCSQTEYLPYVNQIYMNRIFYILVSIGLLIIAIKLWDRKRGNIDGKN